MAHVRSVFECVNLIDWLIYRKIGCSCARMKKLYASSQGMLLLEP